MRLTSTSDFLDIVAGPLRQPRVWISLGWLEVVQAYRRTFLGPLWIILQMIIFSIAMTVVLASIFGLPSEDYAAYVVTGMMSWLWLSGLLLEGGSTFITYAQYIKSVPFDKAQFIWASALKHFIIFCHNLVVYAGLVILDIVEVNVHTLMVFPSILLIFALSIPVITFVAILFARYRDMQKLFSSSVIILVMLTPIFWLPEFITGWRTSIYQLNPLHYMIELIRRPLMGLPIDGFNYLLVGGLTVILWVLAVYFYRRYQRFVIFWI